MSRPAPTDTTITPSDPTLAASCLDFLLIELVPLAQRITDQLAARDAALREEYKRSQIFHDQPPAHPSSSSAAAGSGSRDGGAGEVKTAATTFTDVGSVGGAPTDNTTTAAGGTQEEIMFANAIAGTCSFSANRPRPQTPLDSIKFVCKDLWPLLFRKQIDNLKTNHRGVFVLTDQRFQPISRVSVDRKAGVKAPEETLSRAQAYLYFPCGIIRGALAGLGMDVTVHADSSEIPAATFHIKTRGAKA
ncbi:hypothetical protein MBLNU13_g05879t1 [Cladosporium sp. NU13]